MGYNQSKTRKGLCTIFYIASKQRAHKYTYLQAKHSALAFNCITVYLQKLHTVHVSSKIICITWSQFYLSKSNLTFYSFFFSFFFFFFTARDVISYKAYIHCDCLQNVYTNNKNLLSVTHFWIFKTTYPEFCAWIVTIHSTTVYNSEMSLSVSTFSLHEFIINLRLLQKERYLLSSWHPPPITPCKKKIQKKIKKIFNIWELINILLNNQFTVLANMFVNERFLSSPSLNSISIIVAEDPGRTYVVHTPNIWIDYWVSLSCFVSESSKAQIAWKSQKSHQKKKLPGPLGRPWTPSIREFPLLSCDVRT